ncbi:response regulator [Roseospira visakhapatnamensis]|uniref:Two-component system phosphate regulon response regulator OmpR n=1 Tax=Roseospira visakhapatnamensis TaxID=390880 RepID=A0A7W6RES2_9PROT|nr:response regulator [Roseospira visakhapatnamensis]MBB4266967.1 two-component system phosphate regulon response regulator OmpR [Roseospira visakhapatnamensis]
MTAPEPTGMLDLESRPHILVVDDDERLRALLTRYLTDNGCLVSAAADAAEARAHLAALTFDLLVVDVMMPEEDGLSLTRTLRQSSGVPILMLTAMGDPEARIRGLEAGADDYLPKPFEPRELLLRITGILRRVGERSPADAPQPAGANAPTALCFGPLRLDLTREELSRDDEPLRLTTAERQLLMVLARQAGETVSREDLADRTGTAATPRAVDVHVTRLRRKLEPDPRRPRYLQTVRGRGYLLRPD